MKIYKPLFCSISKSRSFSTTVDIHSHFLPHSWPNFLKKYGAEMGPWPWMRHLASDTTQAMLMLGSEEFRPVQSRCWDVSLRLQDMDR